MAFFGSDWKNDIEDDSPLFGRHWKMEEDNINDIPSPCPENEKDKERLEFYDSLCNIHIHRNEIEFNYGTLLCSMCRDGINLLIQREDIPRLKEWWENNKKKI